ncbi:ECF RNA polymerase sigma-E factor [Oxobacter pfennigii]|uniref:RNA polymerase sigma factor n=1 Tax=Oxobacter pfennigii TaxID=36849 RepID=A0A0P8YC91_9CLOT|nr:sigma-70 family RNA polymerase sigma factor [Oxobacter pfennigii]KPU44742.1 ECF RNA polymerase sigma-E factor [Oxobacter pfennigii]
MEAPEKKIIKLCKDNKKEGFDLLFEKYERFIYGIAFRYTASRDDSLDLLQEVYIKIYKAISRFNDSQPLLPWIKKITVNTCLNFLRDKEKSTLSLDSKTDDDKGSVLDYIASAASVEDEVSYMDTKKTLEKNIHELPPEMRMAVILRHMKNMSYEDISKAMSCPVGTVKTYLFRGRKILKDKLKASGIWEV